MQSAQKDLARTLAEGVSSALRAGYARAFCAAAILHYWSLAHARRERRPPPFDGEPLPPESRERAAALGEAAASMGVEDAAYLLGSTYAAMLPPELRAKNGIYYTPPPVVRRLLCSATEAGVDWSTSRVLDPACGGGAFLLPAASRMIDSLRGSSGGEVLENLAARLRGFEVDPFAAWMSQVFLEATVLDRLGQTDARIAAIVEVCDSLTRHEPAAFDLVLGNPPYGRTTLKTEQREIYQRGLFGHANLYGLFLDLAIRKTRKPSGVVAYVTPTSFLSGEYFKHLRALLIEEAPPVSLDLVAERTGVFDDVQQEMLLAVYRRGDAARRARVHFVEATRANLHAERSADVLLPSSRGAPWILPRSPGAVPLVARLGERPDRLASWGYRVSTGPLVWNRFKERLRAEQEPGAVPLIWAEAVSSDGVFSFRASRRNHRPYLAVEAGDECLLVRRPCVLVQRTTSKEQPRRLISAELPGSFLEEQGGAVTVENHLNMVVPIVEVPAVDTATLAAFLNSGAADRVFRCISGSVAVSAYELEAMPLPPAREMGALAALVREGAPREAVEGVCESLYGGF